MVKGLSTMWETQVRSLGGEDLLEEEMATHSSILAWKIPWMEEPGGLQSMGSQRVGHDWATSLHFTSKGRCKHQGFNLPVEVILFSSQSLGFLISSDKRAYLDLCSQSRATRHKQLLALELWLVTVQVDCKCQTHLDFEDSSKECKLSLIIIILTTCWDDNFWIHWDK